MSELRTLFIISWVRGFTTLNSNMTDITDVWETDKFDQLTTLDQQYPVAVVINMAWNKLQREIVKQVNENEYGHKH